MENYATCPGCGNSVLLLHGEDSVDALKRHKELECGETENDLITAISNVPPNLFACTRPADTGDRRRKSDQTTPN
jgi:hypothetical protein